VLSSVQTLNSTEVTDSRNSGKGRDSHSDVSLKSIMKLRGNPAQMEAVDMGNVVRRKIITFSENILDW